MQELLKGIYSGRIISKADEEGLICCQTAYHSQAFNNEMHYHVNTHFSFVLDGACAEKRKEQYERLPGHVTFYHAGEPHQVTAVTDRSRHVNIEIEPSFFERYEIDESAVQIAAERSPDVKFIMVKMFQELSQGDQFSALSLQALILNLTAAGKALYGGTLPKWVTITEDFLRENWNEKITLFQLAGITGVHPVTISKYFPLYFGCTLGEYRRKLKVEKSLSLIKSTNNSLTATAFECGFADQSHFTRTFKELVGLTPTIYHLL